ncbi:hypothetical protein [Bosea sp. 47.2.35]|uniref:hypothetical protein n=1 Tax=Bosea sp. 47.2.35 TaxID=2969304 RepID=UPI00214FACF8|nr:hypothetical protein [Bosea sp. 47.2.35]MCR4520970.1 hypothetical protein [Bosea sp. 47.2.35]
MDTDDESQSNGASTRPLTSLELEALAALDALDLTVPASEDITPAAPSPAPAAPALGRFRKAISQAKAKLANDRDSKLEVKRKADRDAYAALIMETEKRTVRSHQPLTPERKREKERAKYHAKPTSEQSQKRKERRHRAKERKEDTSLPEGFGKF